MNGQLAALRRKIRRLSPTPAALIVMVAVVATIWAAAWTRSDREIVLAVDAANHANSNLAIAYEENAANALGDVDQTLALLEIEWRAEGAGAARAIRQWPLERGFVRGLAVLGEDGTPAIETGEAPAAPTRLREALEFHHANGGRALRIAAPREVPSEMGYAPRVALSRRIENADGSFAGVAVALVDPSYFTRFYARADLGSEGLVSLVGRDGIALARRTGSTNTYAVDMRGSSLFTALQANPSGTFVSVGKRESIPRFMSYRAMTDYPIIVMVGTSVDSTLAPARERIRLYRILAAIASALAAFGTAAVMGVLARQRRNLGAITEAQARLRESIARQEAITEHMAGGVIITSANGTVVSVNRAACKMHGYEPGQVIGLQLSRLVHESHRASLADILAALPCSADFQGGSTEYRALRRDGSAFEAEVLFSAVTIDGERCLVGIVHDITVRKALERAHRRGEALYRATFDQALVGIVHTDLDGHFIRVNRTAFEMLGYTEAEMLALGYRDVTHPEDLVTSEARHASLLADPKRPFEYHVTRRFVRKDGSVLWALSSVSVVRTDDGSPDFFLTMVQDITELKRVEQMKDEFVSTVSHELRTPLTSIRGSLGLLAGGVAGPLPDMARDLVLIAERGCDRLSRLVDDILDTDRIESGKMVFDLKSTQLRPLVERTMESMEGYAHAHRVTLRLAAPGEAIVANVDADRFIQVVTNLISNAVKFSPPEATVEVALSNPAGGGARIEVRDRGPGIAKDFQPRIFQRFSQADATSAGRKGGTGLGLSIAKAIVDHLGGTIGFRPNPGAGTVFFVQLPAPPTSATPAPTRALAQEA